MADTRLRFLNAEAIDEGRVRPSILASWSRSREWKVSPGQVELPYVHHLDTDSPLTRAAEPVLRQLRENLDGQPISIVLSDQAGVVLVRMTGNRQLERQLDLLRVAPGFNFAERHAGTNGIGTALEGGRPIHVVGHEHFADNLEDLACAAAPIRHPVSGKTVGVVDLTCWRRDAGPLLITLAKATASQIREALLSESGAREVELLREYMQVCRNAAGAVFALNSDVMMMNDHARTMLSPADQATVLRHATDAMTSQHSSAVVELSTGVIVRTHTRPVATAGRFAGVVVQLRLADLAATRVDGAGAPARMLLPGLVGTGALWRRSCELVDDVYGSREWLAVEGEPGAGKSAVLRAVHQRRGGQEHFLALDAADGAAGAGARDAWLPTVQEALSGEPGVVVIRHVDLLDPAGRQALSGLLDRAAAAADGPSWVAVTCGAGPHDTSMADLLRRFPRTVEIPPLRHHIEDVQQLVPFLLGRLGFGSALTVSAGAMQMLMRSNWPGNVAQLAQALRRVVQQRRTGVVTSADLPPEIHSVGRRLLTPLESLERDAIVQALIDTHGNKTQAARGLGMSRATIYRKVHEYGIIAAG